MDAWARKKYGGGLVQVDVVESPSVCGREVQVDVVEILVCGGCFLHRVPGGEGLPMILFPWAGSFPYS